MNKNLLLIITLFILLIAIIFLGFRLTSLAIQENPETYTYTKAICNETHCKDYHITCKENKTINKNPIQGAIIKKPENWTDPRTEDQIKKLCD